jgi:hypothetical protein
VGEEASQVVREGGTLEEKPHPGREVGRMAVLEGWEAVVAVVWAEKADT